MESVNPDYLIKCQPIDIPGLICFWKFLNSGEEFPPVQGEPYTLISRSGTLSVESDPGAPLGRKALRLEEGQWLSLPRRRCPALDIHGRRGEFTLVAWVKRQETEFEHCEFIAGQWNETNRGRQYGLFLNISVWREHDQICGHLSRNGGPTPGYKYCIDGAMGATRIRYDEWNVIAMSYDGYSGYAWLNGRLDQRPGLNPYPLAGGLHDGGTDGSDFTVGAVDRAGEMGNFLRGSIAGLAFYERALSPAEIYAVAQM